MNALEKIALIKLRQEIGEAMDRLSDVNEGRQEHLRIFTKENLKRAFDIIQAIEENDGGKR